MWLTSSSKSYPSGYASRLTSIRLATRGKVGQILILHFMKFSLSLLFSAAALTPTAEACSTCGCSLCTEYETQGLASATGLRYEVRYDFADQNQMRSGTGVANPWPAAGHEAELYTRNHYITTSVDYSPSLDWGFNLQIPFIIRTHATNGQNGVGVDDGTSSAQGLGDLRCLARYQGFDTQHQWGLQLGLKLPTGSINQNFNGGSAAGNPLDRGLQLGTGTTDVILGLFRFGKINDDFDYFAQVQWQSALNSAQAYRSGDTTTLNLGLRYLAFHDIVPVLQLNGKISGRDAGANATPDDSGGQTLYLSPGVTFPITATLRGYCFWQLPLYQNLYGYQLAPTSIITLGAKLNW